MHICIAHNTYSGNILKLSCFMRSFKHMHVFNKNKQLNKNNNKLQRPHVNGRAYEFSTLGCNYLSEMCEDNAMLF